MKKIQLDNGPAKFKIIELDDDCWPETIDVAIKKVRIIVSL
jgi:hypothetical protein